MARPCRNDHNDSTRTTGHRQATGRILPADWPAETAVPGPGNAARKVQYSSLTDVYIVCVYIYIYIYMYVYNYVIYVYCLLCDDV